MRIVSVSEMVAIEKKADADGLTYETMMQNAGTRLAQIVMKRYGGMRPRNVLGLVGSGNNGGDTLVALKKMQQSGWQTCAFLMKKRSADDPFVRQLREAGGLVLPDGDAEKLDALVSAVQASAVILDGILGTGFKLPLRGTLPAAMQLVADYARDKVMIAVDCPSGVDCDSGTCAPETLQAELTVCMAAVKKGLLAQPAIGFAGEIRVADIGLDAMIFDAIANPISAVDRDMVQTLLPKREADSHKGTFGKAMIVGGSVLYPGAPTLAAEAAYRVGTGLVCTAIPSAIYDSVVSRLPESIWLMLPHEMGMANAEAAKVIQAQMSKYDAMLIGPGLGKDAVTQAFMQSLMVFDGKISASRQIGFLSAGDGEPGKTGEQPAMVIDADALRLLAKVDDWYTRLERMAVLTPHPGEMAALTGLSIAEIQKDRAEIAQQFSERWGHVVVLKGALTVVAAPEKPCCVIPIATASLATAGTGDVLAGMVTGLLAQGLTAFDAALAGAWLHGVAGLYAERQHGQSATILARDIIHHLPAVLKNNTAH